MPNAAESTSHEEFNFHQNNEKYAINSDVYIPLNEGGGVVTGKIHSFNSNDGIYQVTWINDRNETILKNLTLSDLDLANFNPNQYREGIADLLEADNSIIEYGKAINKLEINALKKNDFLYLETSNGENYEFKIIKNNKNGIYAKCLTGKHYGYKEYFLDSTIQIGKSVKFGNKVIFSINKIEATKKKKAKSDNVSRNNANYDERDERIATINAIDIIRNTILDNGQLKSFEDIKAILKKNTLENDNIIVKINNDFNGAIKADSTSLYRQNLINIGKQILNIDKSDNVGKITRKYGKIAAKFHPDAHQNDIDTANGIFSLLNNIKQLLIDDANRSEPKHAA